jgi:hypothetical protein
VAKPLDAIKSTSFFERVDDIESSGAPKREFRHFLTPGLFLRAHSFERAECGGGVMKLVG